MNFRLQLIHPGQEPAAQLVVENNGTNDDAKCGDQQRAI